MNRKISLIFIALLIIALAYFLPGCDELITEQITIIEAGHPIARFDANHYSGCESIPITFYNFSQGDYQRIIWRFGDGTNVSITKEEVIWNYGPDYGDDSVFITIDSLLMDTICYTYFTSKTYDVSLEIMDTTLPDTGKDKLTKNRFIIIGTATSEILILSDSIGCPGLEVIFKADDTGNVASLEWDFGDGHKSSQVCDTHTYNNEGIYDVTLTLNGAEFDGSSSVCGDKVLSKNNAVKIRFCPEMIIWKDTNEICLDDEIVFKDSTQENASDTLPYKIDIIDRKWDFDDGITSKNPDVTVEYDSRGTKEISLTLEFVTSKDTNIISSIDTTLSGFDTIRVDTSLYDTFSLIAYDTVRVNDYFEASFTASNTFQCISEFQQQFVINFNLDYTGDYDSLEWIFGDTNNAGEFYRSNEVNPFHAYLELGYYDVTLRAFTPCVTDTYIETKKEAYIAFLDTLPTNLTTEEFFTITPTTADTGDTFFLQGNTTDTLLFSDSLVYYTWIIERTNGLDSIIARNELMIDTLSIAFDSAGTFDIKLLISNDCDITDTIRDSVVVTSPPAP